MLAAFDICIKKNKLTEGDRDFLKQLLEVYSFDTDTNIDVEKVFEATFNDKKMEAGKIKFVLLDGIGRAFIDREVSKIDMLEALNSICKRV
jgi:3-dehydroquinate synthase